MFCSLFISLSCPTPWKEELAWEDRELWLCQFKRHAHISQCCEEKKRNLLRFVLYTFASQNGDLAPFQQDFPYIIFVSADEERGIISYDNNSQTTCNNGRHEKKLKYLE